MPTYVLLIKKFLWFVPHVVVCDLRDVKYACVRKIVKRLSEVLGEETFQGVALACK